MPMSRIEVAIAAGVWGLKSSLRARIGTGRASLIVSSLFSPLKKFLMKLICRKVPSMSGNGSSECAWLDSVSKPSSLMVELGDFETREMG